MLIQTFQDKIDPNSGDRAKGFLSSRDVSCPISSQFFPLHLYTGPMFAQTGMTLLRLLNSINSTLNSMNTIYTQLTGIQSEVIAGEKNDRPEFKGVNVRPQYFLVVPMFEAYYVAPTLQVT